MALEAATNAGVYTEKILNENFTNIAKALKGADNRMDMLENGIRHLSGHISELFDLARESAEIAQEAASIATKVKTPSRVKPFIIGAVAGVVAYKYVTRNRHKIDQVVVNVKEEARERFDDIRESVKDAAEQSKTTPSA